MGPSASTCGVEEGAKEVRAAKGEGRVWGGMGWLQIMVSTLLLVLVLVLLLVMVVEEG